MSEKKFLVNTQFSTRITKEEAEFINENIIDLLPDNIDEADVNNRIFLINLVNRTLTKVGETKKSLPGDLKKIQELEEKITALEKQIKESKELNESFAGTAEELNFKIVELSEKIKNKDSEISSLETALENALHEKGKFEDPSMIIIRPTAAEREVTEMYAKKLSELLKKPVTIGKMIFSLFWKYVYYQYTEIDFPFFYTRKQIDQVINKHKNSQKTPPQQEPEEK
ncbi:MAG: hypothetical protein K9H26_10785 [Prolixibacteraceae bacterium]|nr:hypothetical protein [Prolixibacteraceae bacterium]